jgi:hypothetical protein
MRDTAMTATLGWFLSIRHPNSLIHSLLKIQDCIDLSFNLSSVR